MPLAHWLRPLICSLINFDNGTKSMSTRIGCFQVMLLYHIQVLA